MFNIKACFNTALVLLTPVYTSVQGVKKKTFPPVEQGEIIYGNFKTYGGTDRDINGVYSVEDTAVLETWYRPDITSGCRFVIAGTNAVYEIIGEPENIELRNQFLRIKVNRVKGQA